jgi:hypothetical protein
MKEKKIEDRREKREERKGPLQSLTSITILTNFQEQETNVV